MVRLWKFVDYTTAIYWQQFLFFYVSERNTWKKKNDWELCTLHARSFGAAVDSMIRTSRMVLAVHTCCVNEHPEYSNS